MGSGGCGKTRLVLQVAAGSLHQYPDGVWFVELASLADPAFVANSVAAALGIPERPARPLIETLADYLQTKTLLLVLDNCEHLHAACQGLADHLLRASGTLQILATSRESLGVEGEITYHVPPLGLPHVREAPPVAQLAQYDAIRLFTERAMLARTGFTVTASNAPAIRQICERLEGMPLAIEFAAAHVAALSVEQIAARLDDRFRLLTAGSKKTPRHQTLRATLDWSHALLTEQEQVLFRRLSVFAGGFTLEAAENVCAGSGVGERDILDLLTRLVSKSLIVFAERKGQARYHLLETVRQYGRDRLQESDEADHVQRRHRDWYLTFAEEANSKLRRHEQDVWLDRLETEHDNLRAALAWSEAARDGIEAGLRLAGALRWFWYINGHWSEGRRWLEETLSAGEGAEPSVLAEALWGAVMLAMMQGDLQRERELSEQIVRVCEPLNDYETRIRMRIRMGNLAGELGDVERAQTLLEEGVTLAREFGDKWVIAFALTQLGDAVRSLGGHDRASRLYEESILSCSGRN
jgi:predicted ATPase